jgi:hypothetical protein
MLTVQWTDGPISGSTPEILRKRLGVDAIYADDLKAIRSANQRGVPIYGDICPYSQEIHSHNFLELDENLERLEEAMYQRSQDI